jgi:hypothetical protein
MSKQAKDPSPKVGPSEETKAKFREALARKQGQAAREGEAAGEGKLHDSHGHGPASSQRMFRRKAGG